MEELEGNTNEMHYEGFGCVVVRQDEQSPDHVLWWALTATCNLGI